MAEAGSGSSDLERDSSAPIRTESPRIGTVSRPTKLKRFAYYSLANEARVSPIRGDMIPDLRKSLAEGRIDSKHAPQFRSDIAASASPSAAHNQASERLGEDKLVESGMHSFWASDQTRHLYEAMKSAREEIAEAIRRRKLICFEAIPMNFEEEGYSRKTAKRGSGDETGADPSNWSVLAE